MNAIKVSPNSKSYNASWADGWSPSVLSEGVYPMREMGQTRTYEVKVPLSLPSRSNQVQYTMKSIKFGRVSHLESTDVTKSVVMTDQVEKNKSEWRPEVELGRQRWLGFTHP